MENIQLSRIRLIRISFGLFADLEEIDNKQWVQRNMILM
jgi:hypothetical protein